MYDAAKGTTSGEMTTASVPKQANALLRPVSRPSLKSRRAQPAANTAVVSRTIVNEKPISDGERREPCLRTGIALAHP